MKINIIKPKSINLDPWVPAFKNLNCETLVNNHTDPDVDFVIGASVSVLSDIQRYHKKFPNIPMINYNWDVYEWVWTHPRGRSYDWVGYGEILKKSKEIWCPSESVVKRNKEWYGISEKKSYIIKTFVRLFEHENPLDKRYVLNPLRQIPDRNFGWFEKACGELGIPFKSSNHGLSDEQFKEVVAGCSFIVCPWYEASTGGLTLVEGYALGKPVLISDSPYMGAFDYFGERAYYFKHDSYDDFKEQINNLWLNTPKLDVTDCRQFVQEYTVENMVNKMFKRLLELKND